MKAPWLLLAVLLTLGACGGGSGSSDATDAADVAADPGSDAVDDATTPDAQAPDLRDVEGDTALPDLPCTLPEGEPPDSTPTFGCAADWAAMASRPLDGSISGARSSKTVIDQADGNALYLLNAVKYPIHYDFCAEHLSGHGLPPVGELSQFSSVEYYSPARRFLLGALTHYEGPDVWAYEIAPYDTASAEMVATAYALLQPAVWFGARLVFHPTSENVERLVPDLPPSVKVITTDELFAGITYLPMNLGEAVGQLRFLSVDALEAGAAFVTPRDLVVLDRVPNDISTVAGIVTDGLQTPLSHVNVLSQNRGTPNMVLIGAMADPALRALEGRWVRLRVDAFEYSAVETSQADADAWWATHKPAQVTVPTIDPSVTDLRDVTGITLDDIPAFGAKAAGYGVLSTIGDEVVPVQAAFAVPVHYYRAFAEANGIDGRVQALLDDPAFVADIAVRDQRLAELRDVITAGTLDPDVVAAVKTRIAEVCPGGGTRFRSSTNAEDLQGFTGAGLYESKTGYVDGSGQSIETAIRKVYASLWNLRAFEERSWRGIDHLAVAMALLVHRSFPDEEAQGVALTANLFDAVEPAFYVNVQKGDTSVVQPPPGVTTDQFLYYFDYPNQPMTFLAHSSLVPEGTTVLTVAQTYALGKALKAIHGAFSSFYYTPGSFYAMDVEFKFDDQGTGGEPTLWLKQARPHPGWSVGLEEAP